MLKNIVSVIMTIAALSLVTVPAFAAAHPGSNHNEPGFHQGGFRNHGGFGWLGPAAIVGGVLTGETFNSECWQWQNVQTLPGVWVRQNIYVC